MTLLVVDKEAKKAYTDSQATFGDNKTFGGVPKAFAYAKKDRLYVNDKLIKLILIAGDIVGGKTLIERLAKDKLLNPFTLPNIGEGYLNQNNDFIVIDVDNNVYEINVRYSETSNKPNNFDCFLNWVDEYVSGGSGRAPFISLTNVGIKPIKAMNLACTRFDVSCGLPIVEIDYSTDTPVFTVIDEEGNPVEGAIPYGKEDLTDLIKDN